MERPFPAYKGDEPYVFVSYAHEDNTLVYPELQRLKDQGFNVWYDEGIVPGASWREELAESILKCDLFIILVSPRSAKSANCLKEVNYALEQDRPVLAVHIEPTELSPGLTLALSDRQAIFRQELTEDEYRDKVLSGVKEHIRESAPIVSAAIAPVPTRNSAKPIVIGFGLVAMAVIAVGILLYTKPSEELSNQPGLEQQMPPILKTVPAEQPAKVRSNWIAVLPLATLTGSGDMEMLAAGITTQMIHALDPISSFYIVPYGTVENFRDRTLGLEERARALNVRYVLDGRIQHSGNRIRIGVELIDSVLGQSLWQESFDFTETDLLTIQDEVTLRTSRVLSSRMESIETLRLATVPKEEMDASELSFLSANFWLDPSQASLKTSIGHLNLALTLEPNHAGSLANLADLTNINIWMGGEEDRDGARTEACRLGSRAVMLGKDDRQSINTVVYSISDLCGDPARAVQFAERAITENPENAVTWASYAYVLAANGGIKEAFIAVDKAELLDPDALWVKYLLDPTRALTHMRNDDWVQGVQFAQKAINDNPGLFWLQVYLANGLGLIGDLKGAREQWNLVKARFPGLTVEGCHWYFESSMQEEKAQRFVEGLMRAQVES